MRRLRFVERVALVVTLGAVVLVAGVSVYLRIEQYRFRRQAERLLSDVRGLELEKATAAQVTVVVRKWGFEEWRQPKPCTEDECIYRFQLVPKPARANNFQSPFVFILGAYARVFEWLGLRPTVVQAWVQIRGKRLRSVFFSVYTLGRGCNRECFNLTSGRSAALHEPPPHLLPASPFSVQQVGRGLMERGRSS